MQHVLTYTLDRWRVGPDAEGTGTAVRLSLNPPAAPSGQGPMFSEFGATAIEVGGLPETVLPQLVRGLAVAVTITLPDA